MTTLDKLEANAKQRIEAYNEYVDSGAQMKILKLIALVRAKDGFIESAVTFLEDAEYGTNPWIAKHDCIKALAFTDSLGEGE